MLTFSIKTFKMHYTLRKKNTTFRSKIINLVGDKRSALSLEFTHGKDVNKQ